MAVERLIQKIKLGEKRLIQDSMLKLISMISENKKTQEDIIKALPETELVKMMSYLEDSDPYFRKLTARFFLDLLYGNFYVQQIFCEVLGILPYDGKICINRVPEAFKVANKSFPECLFILKKVCIEETRETLPYCWYFSPENVDTAEKPIEFLSEDDREGLEDIEKFFDPLNAMFGFVLRVPKVKKSSDKTTEYVEKTVTAKEYEARRAVTAANTKALNLANSSLEHSLHTRLLNDSKSLEREVVKNVSPARGFMTSGILSSRISYPRNSKPKVDVSNSICNSERFTPNKFALQSERNRDAPTKHMEREINKIFGMKRLSMECDNIKTLNSTAEAKDKKSPFRKRPDTSIDNTELITSKLISSNNESQDIVTKLENSVCSSALNKSTLPIRPNEKSPDISLYKVANEKKSDNFKKSVDKYDKSYSLKAKQSESDKRSYKNSRESTTGSYSSSATPTPKNSLLSKILKDKPLAKEAISVSKYSKTKQDPTKRLNTTQAVSASQTTKHVAQKYSIGFQPPKNFGKPEVDYSNKKYGFHSALLKSIDLHDQTNATVYIEEKEESAKENFYQDETERRSSIQSKSKVSQLSSVLKGTIATPRTPTDLLKSTISQTSKILNARRSYDTSSYLTSLARDKRKSEASIPLQSLKNRQNNGKDSSVRNSLSEFTLDFTQSITPKGYITGK